MPNELLMRIRIFFKHGQVGNWLGPANSETYLPEGQAGIQVFVEPCDRSFYGTFLNSHFVSKVHFVKTFTRLQATCFDSRSKA